MTLRNAWKSAAMAILLSCLAVPALAQSLTTHYLGGNQQSGNIFDLSPAVDMTLERFDIHVYSGAELNVPVEVYWREGTALGHEDDDAGWRLLGRNTVTTQSFGTPTPLAIGGLPMRAGKTYGIYIRTLDGTTLAYSNASDPAVDSNADLVLTSYFGKATSLHRLMAGANYYWRQWNGTVHYTLGIVTTCASQGHTGTQLQWCQNVCEKGYTGATLDMWLRRWSDRYRQLPYCALPN